MKPKNCLIFGASGLIGRHLIRKLTQNNFKVTAVTRNIHQKGYILKTQGNPGYINIVESNIFDENKIRVLLKKADICIMNTGGLRAVLPEGIITRGKIYELMPFDNELVILELNKQEFRELLIYLKERNGEPFSGMKLTILQNDSINIQFNNKEIKKENRIRILTSDYLANGGDRMDFFIDKKQYPIGVKVRDAIINYCNSKDTITSKLDARFKYE